MKKRILFVDDEMCVLDGLKRSLHGMRDKWEMNFVSSGEQALIKLSHRPYDVIISDMRMPRMDGSMLLECVRKAYPDLVRFILSGQAEQEAVVRAIGPTHQYLTKPCQPKQLLEAVNRACTLRERLSNDSLRSIVGRLTSIPSPSSCLSELSTELLHQEPSLDRVAAITKKDVGLSCKVLQIVNSSFFGVSVPVNDVTHAICLLGLNRLRPIFLTAGVLCAMEVHPEISHFCDETIECSLDISALAAMIMRHEFPDKPKLANEALLAGLVLDAGQLVLASEFTSDYAALCKDDRPGGLPIWRKEIAKYGASHCDVGAYLLGIWGFSDPIVEAVAFHHEPSRCVNSELSPLTAVHFASCAVQDMANGSNANSSLNWSYLESIGCIDRVNNWRSLAEKVLKCGATA
jgi:HD-like signal output (HDOD) protein/CheY-like chemotaxis protein